MKEEGCGGWWGRHGPRWSRCETPERISSALPRGASSAIGIDMKPESMLPVAPNSSMTDFG
jgi:hypothetical protein